ncbi:MAG: RimK family alpha-L-glutamate ligase [Planctomycetota bacterium]
MANVTRRIGLSLGADICWPICYEEILRAAKLEIPHAGDTVSLEVERVAIQPFSLRQACPYDVVIDRLTHWFHTSREWIKKSIIMDDLYVFNNPWSIQSMEKHTSYCAMMRLGLQIPDTWLIPPKEHHPSTDLRPTLSRYARLFDLGQIGEQLGYPMFMKPYDGGAWVGVSKIDNEAALRAAYEQSGKSVMHLQRAVLPHDLFVRTIGLGPQVRSVRYAPEAALHDRYQIGLVISEEEQRQLADITLAINAFFGWDFNSCETLRQDDAWYPIDFANPCPDSQVTSLHYHFPWIVIANLRWSIFCAVTGRRMRQNLDWQPFYDVADRNLPYRERVAEYGRIARERLDANAFDEFCATHLGHLEGVAWEFLGTERARDAVRQKVQALFPQHEIDEFTELFWGRIQRWRSDVEGNL